MAVGDRDRRIGYLTDAVVLVGGDERIAAQQLPDERRGHPSVQVITDSGRTSSASSGLRTGAAGPSGPRRRGPGAGRAQVPSDTAHPHSWNVITVAILLPFFAALLIADRVALIYATNRVARQIEDQGFPAKPHVSIAGFPFLTQVAAKRLNKVVVSAAGKKLGPVQVKRLDVTLYGIRVSSSYRVRTASELSGTALIGFAGLAGVAGLPPLTVAADGPDRVKITIGPGKGIGTATARVTPAGPGGIRLVVISAGGIPMAALGPLRDISLPLPALPPGTTIKDVSVTGQGVLVHLAGQNVSFGR